MQYVTIGKGLKHSNPNSNHSKGIRIIQMQILTIRKGFEAVESKFDIRSIWIPIRTTWNGFQTFECKFKPFQRDSKQSNSNSNHSKGIRSIQMEILIIRKGFQAFESKFEPLQRDSKNSNANSNLTLPTYQLIHPPLTHLQIHPPTHSTNDQLTFLSSSEMMKSPQTSSKHFTMFPLSLTTPARNRPRKMKWIVWS